MKQSIIILTILSCQISYGQSTAIIESKRSILDNNDLQHVLYFEGISNEKFIIKSNQLNGKDFQIVIKEFTNGNLHKTDTVFNSREDAYFQIKADSLPFAVLTKMLDAGIFKIQFQFNGFSSERKYEVLPEEKDKFTLKSFFGAKTQLPVNLDGLNYFLVYMLPYVRKDKSEGYCEVAQSGVDPTKLYEHYKIPHYFLIGIEFK